MPKVSWGRLIHPGLGGPKVNPKGVADGQPVNIPAPLFSVDYGETPWVLISGVLDPRASAKASGSRQIRSPAKSRRDAEGLRARRKSDLRPRKTSKELKRVRTEF